MANPKYRDYFNIDENYFPCVNESAINAGLRWQDFFPHSAFIDLLKKTERMLSRQEKRSIWISGAYGTGKSYAAYALSKLLSAPKEDVEAYFEKYNALQEYKTDLMQKLLSAKSDGKILTCYRYSSSDLHSSNDLIIALQAEIGKAVNDAGLEYKGENTLKQNILEWLKEPHYNTLFRALISDKYKDKFGGWSTEDIIDKLEKDDSPLELTRKISEMASQENIGMLKMDMDGLISYIKDIISKNNLKAIVFVFDEFSEFFENNRHELTAFQKLVEVCAESPFYLVVVAHKMAAYFHEDDKSANKIRDRFLPCEITMPDTIAFDLMKDALKIKDEAQGTWENVIGDLISRTNNARRAVSNATNNMVTDDILRGILPLHPIAAFLLKHISESFESNQRSMFDFIKNDDGSEAFQWFIDNHGPYDNEGAILTVDLLWDFFYEKGKDNLSAVIRNILDTYKRSEQQNLSTDEKIVLKAILIMQAVSTQLNDAVDVFIATEKNIGLCFEGTDLETQARGLVGKLTRDEVLYKKKTAKGEDWYVTAVMSGDMADIAQRTEEKKKKLKTTELLNDELRSTFKLSSPLKMRFDLHFVTYEDISRKINELSHKDSSFRFSAIIGLAKDDNEATILRNIMKQKATELTSNTIILIDTIATPFGADSIASYAEYLVSAEIVRSKDHAASDDFLRKSKLEIKKWGDRLYNGKSIVYSKTAIHGEVFNTWQEVLLGLEDFVKIRFPYTFDFIQGLTEQMFTPSQLKVGAECGLNEATRSVYIKQEIIFGKAWHLPDYWKHDIYSPISITKKALDEKIAIELNANSKVSIRDILTFLVNEYGFSPCNLYSFITGFLLKEYATDTYRCSDDSNNEKMSIDKMKEIIEEGLKQFNVESPRYREKYIRIMSHEEELFCKLIQNIFEIPESLCSSVEDAVRRVRIEIKKLHSPVWVLKEKADVLERDFIDEFVKLLNPAQDTNMSIIASAIGRMVENCNDIGDNLKKLITPDNANSALHSYLEHFDGGLLLEVAQKIGAEDSVVVDIQKHFDGNDTDGLWLWSVDTCNGEIKKVISEYEFVERSNSLIKGKTSSFDECINAWQEKLKFIKISHAIAPEGEYIQMLLNIATHNFTRRSSQDFLNMLNKDEQKIIHLLYSAKDIFIDKNKESLSGLSEEEITNVYEALPTDLFPRDQHDYLQLVSNHIGAYKNNLKKMQLKKRWFDMTGTETPRKWSDKYLTPILACVPDEDWNTYKRTFGAINKNDPTDSDVQFALEFINKCDIASILSEKEKIDTAFAKRIVGSFSRILPDLDKVREYLRQNTFDVAPYDWCENPEIPKLIRNLAEKRYRENACEKVINRIDSMSDDKLKEYLKHLVRGNMIVGIEILDDEEA
jgi:hypothetical protein